MAHDFQIPSFLFPANDSYPGLQSPERNSAPWINNQEGNNPQAIYYPYLYNMQCQLSLPQTITKVTI